MSEDIANVSAENMLNQLAMAQALKKASDAAISVRIPSERGQPR